MNNLYASFKEVLSQTSKIILVTEDKNYTFKDIEVEVVKISNILLKCNIAFGDRVAVQVEKSEYNLFLYLSCLKTGIIYLPLNNGYTDEEMQYFLLDAKPKLIICDPLREAAIKNINLDMNCLVKTLDRAGKGSLTNNLKLQRTSFDIYPVESADVAVMLYTSGTTGKPKGAMLTHGGLLKNAQELNKVWGINEKDIILHMLPLFHVHGLFFSLHTALLARATIILSPRFDVNKFFDYLPDVTVFMGVPTYYTRLLCDPRLSQENCKNMRLFISGSAPLLSSTFDEFYVKTGFTLLERYGMTETGINTSNPLNGNRKVGTVGIPLPGVNVRVVDADNNKLGSGEIGHIQVKGENLFKGYWGKTDKTKEDFTSDGYFRTGDMGAWDDEGYLAIVGRSKDMIITGGLNVYPKEIESTLDNIEGVTESAIIGIPHPDFGEAVVAVIIGIEDKLDEMKIIDLLKQSHASYKCPKKIFFIDQLPKNTMGKIQKNVLREKFRKYFLEVRIK